MPSSLISARIWGIRSYSPNEDDSQTIEFMPLTLIVGANGTGKTTIIESLKFMISGEEPPCSDCRRNFIHTPKRQLTAKDYKEDYACIELKFKNSSGEICLAKRKLGPLITGKKQEPPSLVSSYKVGQSCEIHVNRQDDWNKLMPKLFGLPNQAILSNVILCHQEDNLWCMGDSNSVKQVFDKIFGCEQYKKEIRNIDEEVRKCKKEQTEAEKLIIRFGEEVKRKKIILTQKDFLKGEIKKAVIAEEELNMQVKLLFDKKQAAADGLKVSEARVQRIKHLKVKIASSVDRDQALQKSLRMLLVVKRPAPVHKPQSAPKKPAPDPIVAELDLVSGNFKKMTTVVDELSANNDMNELKVLIDETYVLIQNIKSKFVISVDESPRTPIEEPSEEDPHDRLIEQERKDIESQIEENVKKLGKLREEVEAIQKEGENDKGAEEAEKELRNIERELFHVRDRRSHLAGSKTQMERELLALENDLHIYKNSNKNYAKSLGTLVCCKIITDDLIKLKKCFQDSITTFHDQMILKINEVLKARWRQIYQGSDIDSIELVDEPTVIRGQKSYNYYMAMSKNGVRMKMREKSSAGQRALAAIIVRMALAELLVRDFTFIALDEPTANLDVANVQALAKSIGVYVRRRAKRGANIQWIIITHDEQFLKALDGECSPFFYRIQMDKSRSTSRIVKVSCEEVDRTTDSPGTVNHVPR